MLKKFSVIPGAERFFIKGGSTGILISHGFMGTPQSVRYIGDSLAKYGYSVLAPRLEGHGTNYEDLETCTYNDWFMSLEKGYKELKEHCSTIFVMGQSMGGTLALCLARTHLSIEGVILVNPALTIPSYEYLRGVTEPRFLLEGEPDIKAENVHEITYEKTPLEAIHQLQQLMDRTPDILSEIKCPVLGFQSIEDHLVPPENTDYIMDYIGSENKQKVVLLNSYHVASMDNDKGKIVRVCHDFVQRHVNAEAMYAGSDA